MAAANAFAWTGTGALYLAGGLQIGAVGGISLLGNATSISGAYATVYVEGTYALATATPFAAGAWGAATSDETQPEMEEGFEVFFGQKRIGPMFSTGDGVPDYLAGRPISDVAADLRAGILTPDQLSINVFKNDAGELITINNRTLGALSEAGMKPTIVNITLPTQNQLLRLTETPLIDSPIPGPKIPVTPSQVDLTSTVTVFPIHRDSGVAGIRRWSRANGKSELPRFAAAPP